MPKESGPRPPSPSSSRPAAARVEASLGLLLRRGTRAALYEQLIRGLPGVTETTYPVISGIARLEPVSSSRLADEIGIDRTATTRYASRLESAGLIARTPDPTDARATLLSLTEQGRTTIATCRARLTEHLTDLLSRWSPSEQDVFAAVLEDFVGQLRSETGGIGAS
ncbi:MAG TPA: MarR family transcriptional regulator [Streptomyces sp.]